MDVIFQWGLQGVVAFGAVGAISYLLKRYAGVKLDPEVKLGLLGIIFFLVGYVPADLGSDLFERIKLAVAGALAIHTLWTVKNSGKGK